MDYAMVMPRPGGPEGFERREIGELRPGPGEALVRHRAIGLNFLDIYHRSGLYPWPVERDLVIGSEAAGIVEAVAPGVAGLKPGDRVAYAHALGACASLRTIAADRLVRLPDSVSDELAASVMLKGMTAHYLIHAAFRVEAGMTVLVQAAAGGVGRLLGQWLAHKGATAIGTAGGPAKVAQARAHGYAHVVDYRAGDFVAAVRELTAGEGVHAVYDSVGRDTWRGSLACLRRRGMFVSFGQSSGVIEGFALSDLATGGSLSACRPSLFHYIADRAELEQRARELFGLLATGAIRADPPERFALPDIAAAHRALEGRKTAGASVLIP